MMNSKLAKEIHRNMTPKESRQGLLYSGLLGLWIAIGVNGVFFSFMNSSSPYKAFSPFLLIIVFLVYKIIVDKIHQSLINSEYAKKHGYTLEQIKKG